MAEPAKVAAAARRSLFYFFLHKAFAHLHGQDMPGDPYLEALAYALQYAHEKDRARLVVTIPPRHLKSIAAAVALPAWALGHDPKCKILVATYGDELSREHASHFADIMRSDWYRSLFPATQIGSSNQSELRTTQGGSRRSVTLGGATTGFGADLIIVDDLMKVQDAGSQAIRDKVKTYFTDTLLTRFNQPDRGSLISIQQRLHEDDLPGALIDSGRYEHLNLPAIAESPHEFPLHFDRQWRRKVGDLLNPGRMNQQALDELRKDLGPRTFSAQFQQNPVAPEGAIVDTSKLHLFEDFPEEQDCDMWVQSWDTASSADPDRSFSVCMTFAHSNGAWYLADLFRARLEFPELKAKVLALKEKWDPDRVLIESASSGKSILQQLRVEKRREGVIAVNPVGSKAERLEAQLDMLYDGRVRFCPSDAFWPDLLNELRAFPEGSHDDQVDSLSQFLNWIRGPRGRSYVSKYGMGGSLKDESGRFAAFDGTR